MEDLYSHVKWQNGYHIVKTMLVSFCADLKPLFISILQFFTVGNECYFQQNQQITNSCKQWVIGLLKATYLLNYLHYYYTANKYIQNNITEKAENPLFKRVGIN